ncbi:MULTISPECIES: cyclopropane-fatty-acyl-phospholipid synthase family protein [unclassified Roseitalea]|uniref:SAM-dependent methyltransferase n=1 Tax=unclassified Roseitalea TaxID=2639107 RepID=UPI00273D72B5|nr:MULTISPECIES: cyclopropane-fatty-acyl-phospholipid synthase family protein [unclassified Roseitalea]
MAVFSRQLDRFLTQHIRQGRIDVQYPDGRTVTYGEELAEPVGLRLSEEKWIGRILRNPELRFGEAYMEGALMPQARTIHDLLDTLWSNLYGDDPDAGGPSGLAVQALRAVQRANSPARARQNVAHHYDLGDDLYRLFLDEDMQYSCAYFAEPGMTLDEAQAAKRAHIARKLVLEPDQRVLDIGSGWGGMAMELARRGATDVLGVTLSSEQLATARRRAEQAGLADRVRFELTDYRDLDRQFDRIVSVGMFEHVGTRHYKEYFDKVARLLSKDGVALIHTIGRTGRPGVTNPWIAKYIFPGGYIPALSEIAPHVEAAGLFLTDLEVLRLHYAETLKAWRERFLANADKAAALHDERFVRMWDFYLATSELSFRYGTHVVFQLQLARRQDAVPLTRDYLHAPAETASRRRRRAPRPAALQDTEKG